MRAAFGNGKTGGDSAEIYFYGICLGNKTYVKKRKYERRTPPLKIKSVFFFSYNPRYILDFANQRELYKKSEPA